MLKNTIRPQSHGSTIAYIHARAVFAYKGMQSCSMHPCAGSLTYVNWDAAAAQTQPIFPNLHLCERGCTDLNANSVYSGPSTRTCMAVRLGAAAVSVQPLCPSLTFFIPAFTFLFLHLLYLWHIPLLLKYNYREINLSFVT